VAVKDGFQWHDHGEVSPWPVDKCPWEGIGTGDVWRYTGRDGKKKYVINYSRWPSNAFPDGQRAYFATSDDLIHWTPEYPYTPNCTEKGVFGTKCAGGVAAPYSNGSIPFIIDQRYYEYHGWDTLTGFPIDEADHSKGIVGFWNAAPNKAHSNGSMSWGFGSAADGEPPRYRWHLGCILLQMPAIVVVGRPTLDGPPAPELRRQRRELHRLRERLRALFQSKRPDLLHVRGAQRVDGHLPGRTLHPADAERPDQRRRGLGQILQAQLRRRRRGHHGHL